DKRLRQRFKENYVGKDSHASGAHRAGGEDTRLAGIENAISYVEHNEQQGRKRSERDLALVAQAEDQHEQRKHGGRWRRTEKIDDEFGAAIDALVCPDNDSDRHTEGGCDSESC